MICSKCQRQFEPKPGKKDRLPRGWKAWQEDVWCNVCWSAAHMLRAVSLPLAEPLDCSREDLWKMLRVMWQQTTECSNWMMSELHSRDIRRAGAGGKIPAMKPQYLYPEARQLFPELPSQSVASLEQACQAKYRAKRYETVWQFSAAVPTFRYPTPFPVHNQSWHATLEDGKPIVSVRIGDTRQRLRLRGNWKLRRQYDRFKLIAEGSALPGELAILERDSTIMIKLVAWFLRPEAWRDLTGTLLVKTGKDHFLAAVNAKDEAIWTYNGDQIRQWVAEHRKAIQRWSEDTKFEQRPVPAFREKRERAVRKFHDRMAAVRHLISRQLVNYAAARRFATIEWDDKEKGYVADFQWFALREVIKQKASEVGLQFVVASGGAEEETPVPLAEGEDE